MVIEQIHALELEYHAAEPETLFPATNMIINKIIDMITDLDVSLSLVQGKDERT